MHSCYWWRARNACRRLSYIFWQSKIVSDPDHDRRARSTWCTQAIYYSLLGHIWQGMGLRTGGADVLKSPWFSQTLASVTTIVLMLANMAAIFLWWSAWIKIKIIAGDHRSLWKALNKILHRCPELHLPDHSSIVALVNTFSSFFINKISVIHSSFPSDSHSHVLNPPDTREVLKNLTCVTADEVRCLVHLAQHKSSDLDPIPTRLVKDCMDVLIAPITRIINLLLTEGSFPSHF